ncbi:PGF-CTERM sorting domain-containing protein [Halostella sp. JP-L12]|uniref:DUF7282 domain-containing protein n=1 Tax=Halostella TaxID=1843185 RepID=UPI000EF79C2F|nr:MULTISPECIES: BGTF surface domain-containing protein [Halostella]NHN48737.1 PGF-CTERM sorting domain-containing protein [Halostella sp. JP-L12]
MTSNTEKFRGLFLAALMVFSVFAGSVAFAGSAAAANQVDADENLNNGETYWQGQVLYEDGFNTANGGEDYQIRDEDGNLVRERTADSDGSALISTSGLEGDYTLTTSSSGSNKSVDFEVAVQDFNVTADDGEVNIAGDNTNETFNIDSNRGSFTVNVSEADGDIDASELETAFAGEGATAVGDNVQIQVSGGTTIEGNFSQISAGEYTLDVEVNDTDAADTVDLNLTRDTGEAEFTQSVVTENVGDVAEVTVELSNSDQGAITIGDFESDGYQANATVTDGDGDGEVTVRFNTYTAGNTSGNLNSFVVEAADSDDDVTLQNQSALSANALLANTTYDMSVRSGTDVSTDASDVATLNLRSRSTDELTIGTAPGSEDFSEASDVVSAISDDNSVAEGDYIVHELDASGLAGIAAENDGLFNAIANNGNITLTVEQDRQRPNRPQKELTLGSQNTTIYSDTANDSYYIVVDSEQLNNIDVDDGSYTTTLTVGEETVLASSDEEVSDSFNLVEPTATVQPPEVEANAGQTIQGQSSLAAGSQVTIRVQSQSSANPFLLEQRATVQDGGSFSADFDFSEAEEGTNFTVDVRESGSSLLDEAQAGTVGEAQPAQISYSGGISDDGTVVTVDEVFLPNGGFVTVHDETLVSEDDAFGSVLGTSEYLEAGQHSDVQVELDGALNESQTLIPMAHQDTNDNQEYDFVDSEGEEDVPYTDENDEAVLDSADVEVGDSGEDNETTTEDTTTETTTEETTTEETTTTEATDGDGDGDSDNDGGQPGFGISVAIVALIAAALLALRRQD